MKKEVVTLTLNKYELDMKGYMDNQWSNFVYNGLWYDPVMEHINQFEYSMNKYINGSVKYNRWGNKKCPKDEGYEICYKQYFLHI